MSAVPPRPKVRNPRTQALIRQETFWQITAPLAVVLLIAVGLLALVVMGTVAPLGTSALADVSLMFLILIVAVMGLFALAVTGALAFGLWYARRELPFVFKRVQDFMWIVAMQIKSMTQRVDNRIVGVHLSLAAVNSLVESFRALFAPWRTK